MNDAAFMIRESSDPLVVLRGVASLQHHMERLRKRAVYDARDEGATWQQIGEALRISRQAAHALYSEACAGPPDDERFRDATAVVEDPAELTAQER